MSRGRNAGWLAFALVGPLVMGGLGFGAAVVTDRVVKAADGTSGSSSIGEDKPTGQEDPAVHFDLPLGREQLDTAPLNFTISGLPKQTEVTVESTLTDADGTDWHATAVFNTGTTGSVAATDSSLRGSYTGVNPSGLIALAMPDKPEANDYLGGTYYTPDGGPFTLRVKVGNRVLAHVTGARYAAPDVDFTDLTVDKDGIAGTYTHATTAAERAPAVLLIAEDTSYAPTVAAHLAQEGYPTLALDYAPDAEGAIDLVPVETLAAGLAWLRHRGEVNPEQIAVIGTGRGTEGAALLAAAHPEVHGLALVSPSFAVLPGDNDAASGWTIKGVPVPAFDFDTPEPPDNTLLPVTKVNGPVVLICGALVDDEREGCDAATSMGQRLSDAHFPWDARLDRIDGIGASAADIVPYQAHTEAWGGGTLAEEARAMPDVWTAVKRVLQMVSVAYAGQGEGPIGSSSSIN